MYRMDKIREWFSYWFGGLTAMGGVLSLNDWALIVGILCTIGTFGINWYYKRKEREDRLNGNVTGTQK
ncbi:TPA: phage holin family protein [Enterobacter cloacae]|uniref:HP1 family phage holin n=1 Tax=Enterobacter cloacae TaxID=550 RepID=UPI000BE723C8|nr:HP1 family phage holin [Enterobacter cloacae]ELV2782380.1 phage holin family protein [Enterobacter cloacae]MDE7904169.1 phage holin family protein [Enterobacter cloacae]MDK9968708.1 phage holin family protein [Enterobacter cloacae]MDK9973793.1 phage holin family protein [Enterobacter cloacae]MDL0011501.1 phage holin family protein [Enterobacter cloacae]